MNFGVSSMVLPLKKVALLRPGASLLEADINKWHYSNIFNPDKVQGIYNNFVNLLTDEGVEIFWIEENTNIADAIFTCLLYTSPSPRDLYRSRMPSSA